jgi:hypothetical protein
MPVKTTTKKGNVYIANESFIAQENGIDQAFHQGRTRRYESDEIVQRCPHLFDLLEDVDNSEA